eukprot:IDg14003t1
MAFSVLVRGLGDKPLSAVLKLKKNRSLIWSTLQDRNADVYGFKKETVQSQITRLRYRDQHLDDYIGEFEKLTSKLGAMDASSMSRMLQEYASFAAAEFADG